MPLHFNNPALSLLHNTLINQRPPALNDREINSYSILKRSNEEKEKNNDKGDSASSDDEAELFFKMSL